MSTSTSPRQPQRDDGLIRRVLLGTLLATVAVSSCSLDTGSRPPGTSLTETPAPSASAAPSRPPGSSLTPAPTPSASAAPSRPSGGVFTSVAFEGQTAGQALLLPNGSVLVIGEPPDGPEIFDPTTDRSHPAPLAGKLRQWSSAYALLDGDVLVLDQDDQGAWLYNPATGQLTETGSRSQRHDAGAGVLLSDGRLLLAGGVDDSGMHYLATAELYDPATGHFTATGSMRAAREAPGAALLPDGRVLIAGGDQGDTGPDAVILSTAEIFDPRTGQFSSAGRLAAPRSNPLCASLPDGRVLVAGGETEDNGALTYLTSAETYDPTKKAFQPTGAMDVAHFNGSIVALRDGRLLVAGGLDTDYNVVASAQIYDPAVGFFSNTGAMTEARVPGSVVALPDGRAFFFGGQDVMMRDLPSAEIYWP